MRKLLLTALCLSITYLTVYGAEVPELVTKLKDKDSDVRRAAAKDLFEMGPEAKGAIPALTKALKDQDKFVRRFAAQALGAIGPDAKVAVTDLRNALADSTREVQLAAVEALAKIGPTPSGIQALIAAVKDPARETDVRRQAADGLGKMGKEARSAVKPLTEALSGGPKMAKKGGNEGDIRMALVLALAELATSSDKDTISAIQNLNDKKQRDKQLRNAAAQAVKKIQARTSSD